MTTYLRREAQDQHRESDFWGNGLHAPSPSEISADDDTVGDAVSDSDPDNGSVGDTVPDPGVGRPNCHSTDCDASALTFRSRYGNVRRGNREDDGAANDD